jgi:hypothetical protein
LAITLGNSGKNLPSSGGPSFAERSCTGLSAKNFFKKNKKPSLPTAFDRSARHRVFQKKNPLPTAFASGSRHMFFSKKNKKPPLCRRPGLNAVGKEGFKKTVNLPRR